MSGEHVLIRHVDTGAVKEVLRDAVPMYAPSGWAEVASPEPEPAAPARLARFAARARATAEPTDEPATQGAEKES